MGVIQLNGVMNMISTKGRYALRVMIDLAQNDHGGYIPLKDIAERQEISKKYLEIIVKKMVEGGLIEGSSGKGGGYKLLRKPNRYTVGEILTLMEGTISSVACLADKSYDCPRKNICKTLPMWTEYDKLVHDFFYGKKLTDLMES
jgi:Rrf2 family protein